jgi:hypothetical protein
MFDARRFFNEVLPARFRLFPKQIAAIEARFHFDVTGPNGGAWFVDSATGVHAGPASGNAADLALTIDGEVLGRAILHVLAWPDVSRNGDQWTFRSCEIDSEHGAGHYSWTFEAHGPVDAFRDRLRTLFGTNREVANARGGEVTWSRTLGKHPGAILTVANPQRDSALLLLNEPGLKRLLNALDEVDAEVARRFQRRADALREASGCDDAVFRASQGDEPRIWNAFPGWGLLRLSLPVGTTDPSLAGMGDRQQVLREVVLDSTTLARLRVWVVETLRVITEQPDLLVAADPARCGTPSRPPPLPRAKEQSAQDRSTSEPSSEPRPLPGERAWALDRIAPLLARADPESGATEEEQRTTASALVGLIRKYGLRIS